VNTVPFSGVSNCAVVIRYIRHRDSSAAVTKGVVTDRHIRDFADRTSARLVLWCQQQSVSGLAEAPPCVLEDVALDQHALGILQFEKVLHHEGVPSRPTDKIRLSWHPHQWLEKVVMPDFDVSGGCARGTSAKENAFGGSLKEVIGDFVRAAGQIAVATTDHLCISAGSNHRDAVEVISVGINQSSIGDAAHVDCIFVFVLRSSGEPHSIKVNVVRGARGDGNVLIVNSGARGSRDFQSQQAVVVCTAGQDDWAADVALRLGDDCEYVLRAIAVECRPSGKRRHTRIARLHPRSFGRQAAVGSAGAHDDPVLVVAGFCRESELAGESRACRQFNRVATIGVVEGGLQAAARVHLNG
jgi:hypothetical protein